MRSHSWKHAPTTLSPRERKPFFIALAIAGVAVFILLVIALFGL